MTQHTYTHIHTYTHVHTHTFIRLTHQLIDLLDTDNDGIVSVSELTELIKEKKAKVEVEALEEKVKASQAQREGREKQGEEAQREK